MPGKFRADHSLTMEARKLLYTALVVAPVVLMAGIGVHARTYVDPFEWPNLGQDHQRISAYVPYLIKSQDLAWRRAADSEAQARRLAMILIEGKRSGKLTPLIPVTADELTPHGQKANVYESATMVSRFLISRADLHIAAGDHQEAITNLVLASESLSPLKYSEFTSLFRCTLQQGNILHRFEKIYPLADENARLEMQACMERIKGDRRQFAKIAKTARRIILECFGKKHTMDQAIMTTSNLVPEPSFFEQPALAKERPFIPTDVIDLGVQVPNQRIEAQQCIVADERNRAMIQRIMALSPKRASL
jgi:hypothetical protein